MAKDERVRIDPSEITPEHLYLSRRKFMANVLAGMGAVAVGGVALSACGRQAGPSPTAVDVDEHVRPTEPPSTPAVEIPSLPTLSTSEDELGDKLTPYSAINTYNNYYEFTFSKEGVAELAQGFKTDPWTVEVGGLVNQPRTFDLDDIFSGFSQQERIYRMRCVEAWSMVIPWVGFPLAELLKEVEPTSNAKYVRFETLYDPDQMPGQRNKTFPWPYVEGLRLDEAMHDLTILATGIYGKPLLPQTGAPVRLVVPWKYGFKSIKSIVKIELVEEMLTSTWMAQAPQEYGFYANVNPNVPHPRWSQATERRIGEIGRRKTTLFNGYEEQVADLYEGMDLSVWF
jgi:sulfoxide reductase catalytic subunit YedY